jgi:transcription-repair coupling factor (superfamily II helicase)
LKDFNVLGLQVKLQPVDLTEAQQVQLTHLFPGTRYLQSAQTLMVPAPRDANFEPLRDKPIIDWAWAFLARVFPPAAPTTDNDKAAK